MALYDIDYFCDVKTCEVLQWSMLSPISCCSGSHESRVTVPGVSTVIEAFPLLNKFLPAYLPLRHASFLPDRRVQGRKPPARGEAIRPKS